MKAVSDYLQALARTDKFGFYSDLAKMFDLPPLSGNFSAHPFHAMFDHFDREDHVNRHPFRTALVISKEKNMPGDGFFKTLTELRQIENPKAINARMALWITELEKLRNYYSKLDEA